MRDISIHAPLAGCDPRVGRGGGSIRYFNPRTPCGVRRADAIKGALDEKFQSTHPLRGATRRLVKRGEPVSISIHAPLAGCDLQRQDVDGVHPNFNPRTPCGVRLSSVEKDTGAIIFQSTHPLRGATRRLVKRGEPVSISIHAPLAGCDRARRKGSSILSKFQSTHPLRGATRRTRAYFSPQKISIHAPLAGCDVDHWRDTDGRKNFNPRTPCGVRQLRFAHYAHGNVISIHAPLAGCDRLQGVFCPCNVHFNPRTPCGVRQAGFGGGAVCKPFQSTHPLRGATR